MTELGAIVGAAFVRAGDPSDAVTGVVPRQVVRPASIAEVQAVVRAVGAAGERLSACGLGAHRDLGAPPERIDVLVQLDRLARIVDHQAADMTATVEAGCSLAVLDERLMTAGQWLPLDPPRSEVTSVGGLVAANLSGPLRASQGTARDSVIGMTVVGFDGARVTGGGRVVKNVAGYDMPKLHIGAMGTLGIIVEVTFKVRPRPAREAAIVIACGSAEEAADAALRLRDLVEPYWLVAASAGVLPTALAPGAAVVVGLAGIEEEISAHRDAVMADTHHTHHTAIVVDDAVALRRVLADFPALPASAVLRCATLPTDIGTVVRTAEHAAIGGTARCVAHVVNGIAFVAIDGDAAVTATIPALRALVAETHGGVIIDRAAPAVKQALDTYGPLGDGATLMRAVRTQFDPASLFATR